MRPLPFSQRLAIYLGIGWSLLYSTILINLTQLQRVELGLRDQLLRQRTRPVPIPTQLLLVIIEQNPIVSANSRSANPANPASILPPAIDLGKTKPNPASDAITSFELRTQAVAYANLVEKLLNAGARGVLLNLPSAFTANFSQPDRQDRSIQNLVTRYRDRLVLTAYPYSGRSETPILPIYNKFLPDFSTNLTLSKPNQRDTFTCWQNTQNTASSTIEPQKVLGFFEFNPVLGRADNSENLMGRIYSTQRKFERSDCINGEPQRFDSAVFLAFKNFLKSPVPDWHESKLQINFWGQQGQRFPRLRISDLCVARSQCSGQSPQGAAALRAQVKDKIILVGSLGSEPNSFLLSSPFGDRPTVEIQANLLASMLTNSFYYPLDDYSVLIVILGACLLSSLLSRGMNKPSRWYLQWGLPIGFATIVAYGGLVLLIFEAYVMLPIVLPVLAWLGTGTSVAICLMIWQRQERFERQQQALVEQEAVLSQTHKLLARVATDIHDGPLQDLKLVMDRLEELETIVDPNLLQLHPRNSRSEPLLDALIRVGYSVRNQLNNMQTIAKKHRSVSPELSEGLVLGMQQRLRQLVESGELRLQVIQNLQPLREPRFDKIWIDAREDIFRFFKEAINNAMRHAQAPSGNGTYVRIRLEQQANQCTLTIENDGAVVEKLVDPLTRPAKGQGTKLMATLAAELPAGEWEQQTSTSGEFRVLLRWTIPTVDARLIL